MTESKYLPAVGGHSAARGCEPPNSPARYGTPLFHGDALLSYYYWRKAREVDLRTRGYIFGDSGGFSVYTLDATIDPVAVLRWQEAVCTAGCILDVPVIRAGGGRGKAGGGKTFGGALQRTVTNTQRALPLYLEHRRAGSAFRWWGVLHGGFGREIEAWWNAVRAVYPFDDAGEGWCVKPEPRQTPESLALMLGWLRDHGVRRAHFLACGGTANSAVVYALAHEAGLEFVSSDATNATNWATQRLICVPTADGLSWRYIQENQRRGERFLRDYMWAECPCGYCAELRSRFAKFEEVADNTWQGYAGAHNWHTLRVIFENMARAEPSTLLEAHLTRQQCGAVRAAFECGTRRTQTPVGSPVSLLGGSAGGTAAPREVAPQQARGTPRKLTDYL